MFSPTVLRNFLIKDKLFTPECRPKLTVSYNIDVWKCIFGKINNNTKWFLQYIDLLLKPPKKQFKF